MKIYIDLVFLLNVYIDFLVLLITSIILKRNVSFKRIILGSLVGGLTIICLFLRLNNLELFLIKFIFSILMVIITFSYKNFNYFINNLGYLYVTSIVLGGGLYLLDLELNFNNILFVLFFSLIILWWYLKEMKKIKFNYNNYVKVIIEYKRKKYCYVGYIDSGNKLVDQYKKRPISLIYTKELPYDIEEIIYVPYETASGNGLLKCIRVDKLMVENQIYKNSLIGFMNKQIKIDGVDIILNNKYMIMGGK